MRPDRRCRLCGFNTQATDGTSRRQIQIQNCVISGQMQAKPQYSLRWCTVLTTLTRCCELRARGAAAYYTLW